MEPVDDTPASSGQGCHDAPEGNHQDFKLLRNCSGKRPASSLFSPTACLFPVKHVKRSASSPLPEFIILNPNVRSNFSCRPFVAFGRQICFPRQTNMLPLADKFVSLPLADKFASLGRHIIFPWQTNLFPLADKWGVTTLRGRKIPFPPSHPVRFLDKEFGSSEKLYKYCTIMAFSVPRRMLQYLWTRVQ